MFKFNFFLLFLVITILKVQAAPTASTETDPDDESLPTTVAPPYHELLLARYRTSCMEMSGSEEGYLKTVSSFGPAMACFVGTDGVAQFMAEMKQIDISSKEQRQGVIEKYRPALNQSLECFNDIIEGAAMCSGDDVAFTKRIYQKIFCNCMELICKDGGQLIFDFQKPEVKACAARIAEKAESCKVYDSRFKKPISQYGEVECRALKESKKCLKQLADTCEGSTIMDVFYATYEPIEEATNCKEQVDGSNIEENTI